MFARGSNSHGTQSEAFGRFTEEKSHSSNASTPPGVPYVIQPLNTSDTYRWLVEPDARKMRETGSSRSIWFFEFALASAVGFPPTVAPRCCGRRGCRRKRQASRRSGRSPTRPPFPSRTDWPTRVGSFLPPFLTYRMGTPQSSFRPPPDSADLFGPL